MALEAKILYDHLVVGDDCLLNDTSSQITAKRLNISGETIDFDVEEVRDDDGLVRGTSHGPAGFYIFYENVALSKDNLNHGIEIDVKCPRCGDTYTLGEQEWQMAQDKYEELTGEK